MIDFATWQKVWEAGMAERGYPNARLDPVMEQEGISYAWTADVNFHLDPANWGIHASAAEWETAHAVFLTVDHLRPREVMPSHMLRALLAEQSE